MVRDLEGELNEVRDGLATQRERHGQLLNTKMRLEREIKTYRRLLDNEEGRLAPGRGQCALTAATGLIEVLLKSLIGLTASRTL